MAESLPAGSMTGSTFRQIGSQQIRFEQGFASPHPVDVPLQRVDLPVVAEVAVGMGPAPVGKGVGAEAGMDHGQSGLECRLHQVRVEAGHLVGPEHPLVHHRPGGEAGHVEHLLVEDVRGSNPILRAPPNDVELSFQVLSRLRLPSADEKLANHGLAGFRSRSQQRIVDWNRPPAQDFLALLPDHAVQDPLALEACPCPIGEEDHADAVGSLGGQPDSRIGTDVREETVGRLQQNPGSVPRILLAAARSPVIQVEEHLDAHLHELMGDAPLHIHQEPDAARVCSKRGS